MNGEAVRGSDSEGGSRGLVYQYSTYPHPTRRCLFLLAAVFICSVSVLVAGLECDTAVVCKASVLFVGILIFKILTTVKEESLVVIWPVGLQSTTVFTAGRTSSTFIPRGRIQDVVINEAISGFRVVRYLAVIVTNPSGTKHLHPLFTESKPRLAEIRQIYRDIQQVLGL